MDGRKDNAVVFLSVSCLTKPMSLGMSASLAIFSKHGELPVSLRAIIELLDRCRGKLVASGSKFED